ncbi:uncharacterized protein LOC113854646 [Abrus precatorius]|uniref:Uncharacterized protein LOC113854646 n=1 Tax=Abrus precatorius TaxID=3816 RepID=A0A8B8KCS0_ABRPR|nr:uncharacterized protein LOC113854646 [Abrus precatorius]
MAESSTKILGVVLFLVLVSKGYGQCSLSDLSVKQSQTGVKVQQKEEWSVTITNNCACVQKNVLLNCYGFQSAESIDPSVLRVSGSNCLLNNGQPIYKDAVSFKYASDQQFPLNPVSSEIACS